MRVVGTRPCAISTAFLAIIVATGAVLAWVLLSVPVPARAIFAMGSVTLMAPLCQAVVIAGVIVTATRIAEERDQALVTFIAQREISPRLIEPRT